MVCGVIAVGRCASHFRFTFVRSRLGVVVNHASFVRNMPFVARTACCETLSRLSPQKYQSEVILTIQLTTTTLGRVAAIADMR